jgi:hypothetical protein
MGAARRPRDVMASRHITRIRPLAAAHGSDKMRRTSDAAKRRAAFRWSHTMCCATNSHPGDQLRWQAPKRPKSRNVCWNFAAASDINLIVIHQSGTGRSDDGHRTLHTAPGGAPGDGHRNLAPGTLLPISNCKELASRRSVSNALLVPPKRVLDQKGASGGQSGINRII